VEDIYDDKILGYGEESLSSLVYNENADLYEVIVQVYSNEEFSGRVFLQFKLLENNSDPFADTMKDDEESLCDMMDMSVELQSVTDAFGDLDDAMNFVNIISERQMEDIAESVAEMVLADIHDPEISEVFIPALYSIADDVADVVSNDLAESLYELETCIIVDKAVGERVAQIRKAEEDAAIALALKIATEERAELVSTKSLQHVVDLSFDAFLDAAVTEEIDDRFSAAMKIIVWFVASEQLEITALKAARQQSEQEFTEKVADEAVTLVLNSQRDMEYMLIEHLAVQEAVEKQLSADRATEVLAAVVYEIAVLNITSEVLSESEIKASRILGQEERDAKAAADEAARNEALKVKAITELADAAAKIAQWVISAQEMERLVSFYVTETIQINEAAEAAVSTAIMAEEVDEDIDEIARKTLFAATADFLAEQRRIAEIAEEKRIAAELEAARIVAHEKAIEDHGVTVSSISGKVIAHFNKPNSETTFTLNDAVSKGIYIVRAQTKKGISTGKLIVQ
jgi:hypothetical protein